MWLVLKIVVLTITITLFFLGMAWFIFYHKAEVGQQIMYFQQSEAEKLLEQAIENDDATGVIHAIQQGADPNTTGLQGITPLILAVGKFKKQAITALLQHKADIQQRDLEQDNAMTLAVRSYRKDPNLLVMLLKAGGDPNTLFANGDPIIVRFLNDSSFHAARYLHKAGANIDANNKSERPLIIGYAIAENWDVVWALLELGAQYDYPQGAFTWQELFSTPDTTPPDSPLWSSKVKAWKFLKQKGQVVPETIEQLVGQQYWDYLEEKGLPKPSLE